jgi:hypothetical protein
MEKINFVKKRKKNIEQQRQNQFMEEYFLAVGDTRENTKKRKKSEEDEYKSDIIEDEQIKEFKSGLIGTADGKILVPKSLREKILIRFHDSPFAGHLGVKKTIARIQRRFKWPFMVK